MSVDFVVGNAGVELRDGTTCVRADTFYSAIVDKAVEMGFLGEHLVAGTWYHTSVIIFVSKGSSYYTDSRFKSNETKWGGVRFATLGAGSTNNELQSDVNRPQDANLSIKTNMHWLYSGVGNATKLFDAEAYYRENHNNLNYDTSPKADVTETYGKGYNSNSFTAGLLQAVGISAPTPVNYAPGWGKPVPTGYYKSIPKTGR